MKDDTAEALVRLLTDISEQLTAARKHRVQLEDMILNVVRTVEGNSNMLLDIKARLDKGDDR